jgi:non-ribosomal peptide synthetase component F
MYRTGDLGRQRNDGRVECLGRTDRQLKFHGFRIEPDDIETALLTHRCVAQAVVALVAGSKPDEPRLVAYIVADAGKAVSAEELRLHLREILPAYLVPTQFVVLDALPLTPNGKVDRATLPPLSDIALPVRATLAPTNDVERTLADIWAAVLNVDRVGVNDSFFDLGGHSLLLAKVRAAIASRLGRDVAVIDLFRYHTIRSLATHLNGLQATPLAPIQPDHVARQVAAFGRFARAAEETRSRNV